MNLSKKYFVLFAGVVFCFILTGCDLTGTNKTSDQTAQNESSSANKKTSSATVKTSLVKASASGNGELIISAQNLPSPKTALDKIKSKLISFVKTGSFTILADEQTASAQSTTTAKIGADTKRITFLSSTQFLYLNKTNKDTDYAEELVLYDLTTDAQKVLYKPTDGFALDEYVVSPDKTLIAVWELKKPKGQTELLGGESRITQVNIQTGQITALLGPQKTADSSDPNKATELAQAQYSLDPSMYIQYPLFYDSQNRLWLDIFGPNGGYWGNGIYTLSAPQQLQKYADLSAGSYSADPVASADGKTILVSTPGGDLSSGITPNRYIVGEAQSMPTTLEIINAQTGAKTIVPTEKDTLISPLYALSNDGNLVAYASYSTQTDYANNQNATFYVYDRAKNKTTKITTENGSMILGFSSDQTKIIIGKVTQSQPYTANSGKKYYPVFDSYIAYQINDPKVKTDISAGDFSEFVSLETNKTTASAAVETSAKINAEANDNRNNLEITSFQPKNTELAPKRASQQNAPKFGDSPQVKSDCESILPGFSAVKTGYEFREIIKKTDAFKNLSNECKQDWDNYFESLGKFGQSGFSKKTLRSAPGSGGGFIIKCSFGVDFDKILMCVNAKKLGCTSAQNLLSFLDTGAYKAVIGRIKCTDSPLYLYPTKDTKVSVNSGVSVYNSDPQSVGGGWQVTASPNGTISSNGQKYSKISYDYASSAKAPQTGILVSNDNLKSVLTDYAEKLGLNERESGDFVTFWYNKLHNSAPLFQISHYSRVQSAEILKLKIDPTPDTFIPIVMYFKKLTFPTVLPAPRFEPISPRAGFTALDWSGIVE